jgi:hypothetical protein
MDMHEIKYICTHTNISLDEAESHRALIRSLLPGGPGMKDVAAYVPLCFC